MRTGIEVENKDKAWAPSVRAEGLSQKRSKAHSDCEPLSRPVSKMPVGRQATQCAPSRVQLGTGNADVVQDDVKLMNFQSSFMARLSLQTTEAYRPRARINERDDGRLPPGTEHQAPSTKHQAPSTEHRARSTEHRGAFSAIQFRWIQLAR